MHPFLPILAFLVFSASSDKPVGFCSILEIGVGRGANGVPLTLVATGDTVSVPARLDTARPLLVSPSAFGQVVQIIRLAPDAQQDLRDALRASGDRAVLVPWSMSSSCEEMGWGRASYRWITSSAPGFINAVLRPRDSWADGIPTFDVSRAYQEPFPHEGWLAARRFRRPPGDRQLVLTAEEYFEMYTSLPTFEEWNRTPQESLDRIRSWVREHPEVADRYPANSLVAEAEEFLRGGPFGGRLPTPERGAKLIDGWGGRVEGAVHSGWGLCSLTLSCRRRGASMIVQLF